MFAPLAAETNQLYDSYDSDMNNLNILHLSGSVIARFMSNVAILWKVYLDDVVLLSSPSLCELTWTARCSNITVGIMLTTETRIN